MMTRSRLLVRPDAFARSPSRRHIPAAFPLSQAPSTFPCRIPPPHSLMEPSPCRNPPSAFPLPHTRFRNPPAAFPMPHSPFCIPPSVIPLPHSPACLILTPSCSLLHTHSLVLLASYSLPRAPCLGTHSLVLPASYSLPRAPCLMLTPSCSLPHAHSLVLPASYSLPRAPCLILTPSSFPPHTHSLVLTASAPSLCSPSGARRHSQGPGVGIASSAPLPHLPFPVPTLAPCLISPPLSHLPISPSFLPPPASPQHPLSFPSFLPLLLISAAVDTSLLPKATPHFPLSEPHFPLRFPFIFPYASSHIRPFRPSVYHLPSLPPPQPSLRHNSLTQGATSAKAKRPKSARLHESHSLPALPFPHYPSLPPYPSLMSFPPASLPSPSSCHLFPPYLALPSPSSCHQFPPASTPFPFIMP
ncbi:unnamed protein product [Closterium sp. Naga37s-1]|nr:unnamed protein product [Closterium sp. Naga37s-1]